MIRFAKPTMATLRPFMMMKLTPEQTDADLVAPNAATLAQDAYDPASETWFIYDDDTPVGLVAVIDTAHAGFEAEDGDDTNALYLWRLFISAENQKRGFGAQTLKFLVSHAKQLGRPKLYTSYVPHPLCAGPFYEAFGFTPTGRIVDDEVELVIDVT